MPYKDCLASLPRSRLSPAKSIFARYCRPIQGNIDYLALRGQLITMDELLRTSGVENEFVMRDLDIGSRH